MKIQRKKRAPKVSTEALRSWKQGASRDADLEQLSARLLQFEKLRQEQVLNTPFIALEALSALAGASLEGKSEEAVRATWPEAWGDADIKVPLSLILALSHAWLSYRNPSSQKSLGEAFRVEGGGQGKAPMKDALTNLDAARRNANDVEATYLALNIDNNGQSLEMVIETIADERGSTPETERRHHRKHREALRKGLKDRGILKGS